MLSVNLNSSTNKNQYDQQKSLKIIAGAPDNPAPWSHGYELVLTRGVEESKKQTNKQINNNNKNRNKKPWKKTQQHKKPKRKWVGHIKEKVLYIKTKKSMFQEYQHIAHFNRMRPT